MEEEVEMECIGVGGHRGMTCGTSWGWERWEIGWVGCSVVARGGKGGWNSLLLVGFSSAQE